MNQTHSFTHTFCLLENYRKLKCHKDWLAIIFFLFKNFGQFFIILEKEVLASVYETAVHTDPNSSTIKNLEQESLWPIRNITWYKR